MNLFYFDFRSDIRMRIQISSFSSALSCRGQFLRWTRRKLLPSLPFNFALELSEYLNLAKLFRRQFVPVDPCRWKKFFFCCMLALIIKEKIKEAVLCVDFFFFFPQSLTNRHPQQNQRCVVKKIIFRYFFTSLMLFRFG